MIITINFLYRDPKVGTTASANLQAYDEHMAAHILRALQKQAAAEGLTSPTATKEAREPWEPKT